MSRESTLMAGRRFNGDTLTDRVRVQRLTGDTVRDPATGHEDPELATVYASVPAKIQVGGLGTLIPTAREALDAGREVTTTRTILKVPVDEKVYRANDVITVTSVGDLSDVQLLAQQYKIVGVVAGSYQTTRRFSIETVIS